MTSIESDSEVAARLEIEDTQRSEGWRLLREALTAQRRNLLLGALVGIMWASFKVAVPQMTKYAINDGIEKNGPLLRWALIIAGLGVLTGVLSGMRRYIAFRESRWAETLFRERYPANVERTGFGYKRIPRVANDEERMQLKLFD